MLLIKRDRLSLDDLFEYYKVTYNRLLEVTII